MKKRIFIFIVYAFVCCALPVSALAKQGNISLKTIAETEVKDFNEEGMKVLKRVPASKVIPGTEVIYTIQYTNIGKDAAENAVITNPVPEHMIYKNDSATGLNTKILFSVNNGKTYDLPENLMVINKEGKKVNASPKDYTHIKWTFIKPIKASEKGNVSYRAILK